MFSPSVVALVALAVSANAGLVHRRHTFPVPSTYDAPWLEPYQNYHIRYLALSCHTQHNTTFFDQCCHPMLKNDKLEDRPPQCIPSPAASSSAVAALPSSTIVPDGSGNDDPECDDGEDKGDAPANVAADPNSSTEAPATSTPPATSTDAPETKKTTKKKTSTTTSTEAAPTTTNASGNSGSGSSKNSLFSAFSTKGSVHTGGIGTFFFQNGVAGNCGKVNQDSDMLIALPTNTYAGGALCGKKIAIANVKTGVTAVGVVADSCPTCDNDECLDLSVGLYNKFATQDQGVFDLAWVLLDD